MNIALVMRLIAKDWYLSRVPLTLIACAGVFCTALLYLRNSTSGMVSLISAVITLVFLSIILPMHSIVHERKERNLAFVMSLPISSMEYTAAKVLGNLSAFIVLWLAVSVGVLGTLATAGFGGILPLGIAIAFLPFVSFCLMLVAAIVAESEVLAMVVMGICNVFYSFAWLLIIRTGLLEGADGPVPIWSERILAVLAGEITIIVGALALTFYLQSRKTSFI
jgi:ABC-type transport system involved in multi-copper enzyme maturation permease subunit